MISVSQEVIDLINADSRSFRAKFKHGDSVYDKIMSLKWNVCLPSSSFSVGNALSIGIQCTAFDVPVSIKGEELELVITIEGSVDEISIGSFTAEKPTIQNGIISFNAYDDMSKAGNIPYNSTLGEGAHTVNQYIADVAETLGIGYISLDSDGEVSVENDYLSGNSCRNALAYLAGYIGRNCIIKNKKILMKKFTLVDYTMNADRIEEPELEDIDSEIDFIIAQISSNNTIMNGVGATGTEFVCPIMTESQLSNVANMLLGADSPVKTYRSGKVKLLLGDPRLELCDVIKLDYKDTEYIIPVTSISFEYDGGLMTDIEAYALKEPTLLTPSQRLDFAVQEEVKKVLEQLKNIDGTYFYIRYSPNADGSKMTKDPDDKTEYIGVCSTNQASPPDEASAYTWSKFKGKDGLSNFFHVKYSNDGGKTFTDTNGETAGEYIGILVDSNENDSEKPSDYTWSKIVGKDGGTLQVKYKNSATAPTITSNNVSSWSDEVPAPEKGKRTYMTQKLSTETNWSTPIQISAEDGTTPTVTINQDGYWVINGGTTTVKAKGEKPTITVGENGNWFVDDVDTGEKAQGEQGKDGADIEYVYYRSQDAVTNLTAPTYSGGKLSDGWTASPQGITSTYKYEYVSVRTKAAGSTSWSTFSPPVIWSKWGEKGTDGDGVEYKYYLKNNATKPTYSATSTNWTDEPTGVSASNMYEYVVQITHHGDGTTTVSDVALWAKWGETGDKGVSVTEVITEYHTSASDSTAPPKSSANWTTAAPVWADGYFLWTRLKTILTDGSVEYSNPVVDASWKKVTVVEKASKELNQVLANALGLYVTEQNGVRYYHSNPNLSSSKNGDTILVLNAKGFGVCKTGWNSGNPVFDHGTTFDGKAVWDILVANKISADMIEAGSIRSLPSAKVQTTINLDDGTYTSTAGDTKITIQGGEVDEESGAETTPAGILLDNLSDGSTIRFSVSGIQFMSQEYVEAYTTYAIALALDIALGTNNAPALKPEDPYFSNVAEKDIKTTNLHCKNIYIVGDSDGNEYNLMDALSMMSEQVNLLSESLTTLQEKYLALEDALGQQHEHTPASAIKENIVNATCTAQGSYDEVVYCSSCGEKLSVTKKYTSALGHNYTSVVTPPTSTSGGYTTHTCQTCGSSYTDNYTDAIKYLTATIYSSGAGSGDVVRIAKNTSGEDWGKNQFSVGDKFCFYAEANSGKVISSVQVTSNGVVTTYSAKDLEDVGALTAARTKLTYPYNLTTVTSALLGTSISMTVLFEEPMIYEGVETSVNIPTQQAKVYLKFVPQYSGSYTFVSLDQSSLDPDGYIYLADKQSQKDSDTSSGGFSVSWDGFVAGTTYYLAARLWSGTGTLKVKVTKDAERYTVTTAVSPSGAGTVTGGGSYESDSTAYLTATPNDGYEFDYWLIGSGSTQYKSNPLDLYMNANATVTAVFKAASSGEPTYTTDTIVNGTLYIGLETTDINNTSAYANRTDIVSVVIPDGITSIGHLVFSDCTKLKTITIPASVISIGSAICQRCTALTDVYYKGTETQWNTISIGANNTNLTNATIHYNS